MKYERLTDKNDLYWALQETKLSAEVGIYLTDCLNFLAELEDKIEQGTLIELPCKVGDTVYAIVRKGDIDSGKYVIKPFIEKGEVQDIMVGSLGCHIGVLLENIGYLSFCEEGKVFLTREEAEQRLKELQNG